MIECTSQCVVIVFHSVQFFSISNVFRSCQSQFLQKLYSYVLRTYKGVHLILICCVWLLQLHILCALSGQNWISNKKDINLRKSIFQSRAKFVCSIPKKSLVWPHCKSYSGKCYGVDVNALSVKKLEQNLGYILTCIYKQ